MIHQRWELNECNVSGIKSIKNKNKETLITAANNNNNIKRNNFRTKNLENKNGKQIHFINASSDKLRKLYSRWSTYGYADDS